MLSNLLPQWSLPEDGKANAKAAKVSYHLFGRSQHMLEADKRVIVEPEYAPQQSSLLLEMTERRAQEVDLLSDTHTRLAKGLLEAKDLPPEYLEQLRDLRRYLISQNLENLVALTEQIIFATLESPIS